MMEHDDKPTLQVVGDEQGDAESSKATKEALRGAGYIYCPTSLPRGHCSLASTPLLPR